MNLMKQIVLGACALASAIAGAQSPVAVRWDMGRNDARPGWYSSRFTITNVSGRNLGSDWQLYFSQFSRRVATDSLCPVDVKEISTTYYQVTPNARYRALAPGESMTVDLLMRGTMVNYFYRPQGGHIVLAGDTLHPQPVVIEAGRLDTPGQWSNRPNYPDGTWMWNVNQALQGGCADKHAWNIFPMPKKMKFALGSTTLSSNVSWVVMGDVQDVGQWLQGEIASRNLPAEGGMTITMNVAPGKFSKPEQYTIKAQNGGLHLLAGTREGMVAAASTLLAAIDHSTSGKLENVEIEDYPDFGYRGVMLDIARNFTTFDNLKRFVDLLASYKLNRFQFHFTDDEAWRVEIPGLPELTQVASRRGLTTTEHEFLAQIFDGNGNPDDLGQSANGYLTREQMVELIGYAHQRGVKIVPEIETPGHARAAIVAMKARYNRYKDTDMARATEYQLWDDGDTSEFTSAQSYHDNVLNVAQPGVINFVTKVVTELQAMWRDAGLTLDIVHLGGDEVARGAWDKSPAVQALMLREGLRNAHEVNEWYITQVTDVLYPRGIRIQGWQEVAMDHSPEWNAKMAPRFAGVNAWSTQGKRITVPYTLANDGYETILSNVTNFYIDMGYSWHQYEQGLHWGGTTDEYTMWHAQPWNIYSTARTDYDGRPIDLATAAQGKVELKNPRNIIGVVGPLWAETLRDFSQVQRMMLPKVAGLAERSWNSLPEWDDNTPGSYEAALVHYNAKMGQCELPMLKRRGYTFHLGQPGIRVEDGKLLVNSQYPGEAVRYTTDGSEPTAQSPLWQGAVPLPAGIAVVKARAFYLGEESVTTFLWLDK